MRVCSAQPKYQIQPQNVSGHLSHERPVLFWWKPILPNNNNNNDNNNSKSHRRGQWLATMAATPWFGVQTPVTTLKYETCLYVFLVFL